MIFKAYVNMKQLNTNVIFTVTCILLLMTGCSDTNESKMSTGAGEYTQVNEKQYGVKMNKVNLSRPVEGKNYSVEVSGLPIRDEIESD